MGRAPCCDKEGLNRGPWTEAEDATLSAYIKAHGEGSWRTLPNAAGLARCGKSCRLRWINYLRPDIKRGKISPDEDDLIITLHALLGNRWSLIAGRIPGRTDNKIKNYWNTHLTRKLKSMGLDPSARHKLPSFPFSSSSSTQLNFAQETLINNEAKDLNELQEIMTLDHHTSSSSVQSPSNNSSRQKNWPLYPSSPDSVLSTYKGSPLQQNSTCSQELCRDHKNSHTILPHEVKASKPPPSGPDSVPQVIIAQTHPLSTSCESMIQVQEAPAAAHVPPLELHKPGSISKCNSAPSSTCSSDFTTKGISTSAEHLDSSGSNSTIELVQYSSDQFRSAGLCRNGFLGCKGSVKGGGNNNSNNNNNRSTEDLDSQATVLEDSADHQESDPYDSLVANLSSSKTSIKYADDQISSVSSSSSCHSCSLLPPPPPFENWFSPFPEYNLQDSILQHEMIMQPLLQLGGDHSSFLSTDDNFWESCVF